MALGESGKDAFLENFLTSGALRIALAPLHRVAAAWGSAENVLDHASVWQHIGRGAQVTLRSGAVLTAEMITSAAVDYVVKRALHGPPPDDETAASWAIQGASIAIGRFVSGRLSGLEARLTQIAEHGAHLRVRARRLRTLAE